MKNTFLLLIFAITVFFNTSCESDSPSETVANIELKQTETNISLAETDTHELVFKSTHDWTISVSDTTNTNWCKVSTKEGKAGDASVQITAETNNTQYPRSAEIIIKSLNKEQIIKVYQEKGSLIQIDDFKELINMSDTLQHTLSFMSTYDWRITITDTTKTDWCKVSAKEGKAGKASINITANANETKNDREATLTLTANGKEQSIKIFQQKISSIDIDDAKKDIDLTELKEYTLSFNTTYEWTIATTDTSKIKWYKLSAESGKAGQASVKITVDANETKNDRSANINITSKDKTQTIKIFQQRAAVVEIPEKDKVLDMTDKQEYTVTFSTTYDWTTFFMPGSIPDWCEVSPDNGKAGKNTIIINARPNDTKKERWASLVITSGRTSDMITLEQERGSFIEIKQEDKNIDMTEKQEYNISFNVSHDWTIAVSKDTPATWLKLSSTQGLEGNASVKLTAESNTTKNDRFANLVITSKDKAQTIKVSQKKGEGAPGISIPDPQFKAYCLANFDINGDGEISQQEALAVTVIDCEYKPNGLYNHIKSVEGIKYFNNLRKLNCSYQEITSLDLNGNKELLEIQCNTNKSLTNIDLSQCTKLQTIWCSYNPLLTQLDVSSLTELSQLDCSRNELTSLNLSKNTKLKKLSCGLNKALTQLDISACRQLTELDCSSAKLTTLNLTQNVNLKTLECSGNVFKTLDLSKNSELVKINTHYGSLTTLDLSNNKKLKDLSIYYNQLTAIDLNNNIELTDVLLTGNNLKTLDISKNVNLKRFSCIYNSNLTELWVATGHKFEYLDVESHTVVKYK